MNEVRGNTGFVEVEVFIFVAFHSGLQVVLGMIDASTHSCAVSLPGELSELDGGDKTGDDFSEALGGHFVVSGQCGKHGIGRHGGVLIENDGQGMGVDDDFDGVRARRHDGVVNAVVGHA